MTEDTAFTEEEVRNCLMVMLVQLMKDLEMEEYTIFADQVLDNLGGSFKIQASGLGDIRIILDPDPEDNS